MNKREVIIFAAELGADIPELDLHGLYPVEALEKLESFIFCNFNLKKEIVRVVYGGGVGKLREEVLKYLFKHPLIKDTEEEIGSCLILF